MLCVSIAESSLDSVRDAMQGLELAEIRLDAGEFSTEQISSIFSSRPIRLVATHRVTSISDDQRADKLCAAIGAGAAYVDIEIESSEAFRQRVSRCAREHQCTVIISYHNYETTPPDEELNAVITECREKGADVVKLACMAASKEDAARMLSLYRHRNILALAMGEFGKITRVAAFFLGAPFTFVSRTAGKEAAPGQIALADMQTIIDRIGV